MTDNTSIPRVIRSFRPYGWISLDSSPAPTFYPISDRHNMPGLAIRYVLVYRPDYEVEGSTEEDFRSAPCDLQGVHQVCVKETSQPDEVMHRVDGLLERIHQLETEVESLRVKKTSAPKTSMPPLCESIEVKICGVPYLVSREKDKFRVDHDGNGTRLWGQINYSGHSIRFLQSSPEQELRSVVHEILHGIVENGMIRELMNASGEHLEAPINQLANGLAEVLESIGFTLPSAFHPAKTSD